jgi:hypothetical protein
VFTSEFKDDPMILVWVVVALVVAVGGGWWLVGRMRQSPRWVAVYSALVSQRQGMLGTTKAFVAFVSVLAGGLILMAFAAERVVYLEEHLTEAILGVGLFASGLTFFWTQSRFYKRT